MSKDVARGAGRREPALHPFGRMLWRDRERLLRPPHFPGLPPVREHFLGSDRVQSTPESTLHAFLPGPKHVTPQARSRDRIDRLHLLALKALHAAEVQDAHTAVVVKQIVP